MKKIIVILVVFFSCLNGQAQELFSFEKVISVDSISKDIIFSKLSEWIASEFISTDGDYYSNKEDGVITKDYRFQYKSEKIMYKAYNGYVNCKIKIQIKDSKFKITIFNFIHKAIPLPNQFEDFSMFLLTNSEKSGKKGINKSGHDKAWKSIKEYCKTKAYNIFSELEKINYKENSDNW